MSKYDLHETRLGTTDEYGHRVMPQPESVWGKWTKRRRVFHWVLILFYLVLPWIYVNGKQWVRLDIPRREFTLFGNMFYAHDAVYLIFILLGLGLGLAFVTSIWGRVWCGWACPQTVFIETVFRKFEELIEGNARKRKALDKADLSFEKVVKKSTKWIVFILVSLHIVHSFLGYFVGTRELVQISFQAPSENWFLFLTMLILTGLTLFDFGWFREQFCVIACPYGRFQSVLMDENSLVVAYDEKRGEPRRRKGLAKEKEGDCINCYKCVKVCPTGIDIRRGTQMECIACAICVDACDEIMEKVGYEPGLIRYSSETELEGNKRKIGLRSFIYMGLLALIFGAAVFGLSLREDLHAKIIRMPGAPFSKISGSPNNEYLNRFQIKLETVGRNGLELRLEKGEGANESLELISGEFPMEIEDDKESATFFVKFPKSMLDHGSYRMPVSIKVFNGDKFVESLDREVKIVGPLQ